MFMLCSIALFFQIKVDFICNCFC